MLLKNNIDIDTINYIKTLNLDKEVFLPIFERIHACEIHAGTDFQVELFKYGLAVEEGFYTPFWAGIICAILTD